MNVADEIRMAVQSGRLVHDEHVRRNRLASVRAALIRRKTFSEIGAIFVPISVEVNTQVSWALRVRG